MMDLPQNLCEPHALSLIVDVRKNHLAESLTDYCQKIITI